MKLIIDNTYVYLPYKQKGFFMTKFKLLCFSLLIGTSLIFNTGYAQENMPANDMYNKAQEYYTQKDYKNAMKWFLKAADKGNTRAMHVIGYSYQTGQMVQQDYQQAMQWYLKAADKGNTDAMITIGYLYEIGQIVQQDYQQAMKWYLKSADKGNSYAMIRIGSLYKKGLGVKQDDQQAALWRQKAEEANETQK